MKTEHRATEKLSICIVIVLICDILYSMLPYSIAISSYDGGGGGGGGGGGFLFVVVFLFCFFFFCFFA